MSKADRFTPPLSFLEADASRAKGDQARRNVAQNRNFEKESNLPWNSRRTRRPKSTDHQVVLHHGLHALNNTSRPLAQALNLF